MTSSTDDEPLLKPEQAALFLGVAVITLAEWRSQGRGPPYVRLTDAPNAPVRYRPAVLREWVRERTCQGTAQYRRPHSDNFNGV
jgi:hypothetical protein